MTCFMPCTGWGAPSPTEAGMGRARGRGGRGGRGRRGRGRGSRRGGRVGRRCLFRAHGSGCAQDVGVSGVPAESKQDPGLESTCCTACLPSMQQPGLLASPLAACSMAWLGEPLA